MVHYVPKLKLNVVIGLVGLLLSVLFLFACPTRNNAIVVPSEPVEVADVILEGDEDGDGVFEAIIPVPADKPAGEVVTSCFD